MRLLQLFYERFALLSALLLVLVVTLGLVQCSSGHSLRRQQRSSDADSSSIAASREELESEEEEEDAGAAPDADADEEAATVTDVVDDGDDTQERSDDIPPGCVLTQVCTMTDVLRTQNRAAFDRFSSVFSAIDLAEIERSVRLLVDEANQMSSGQTTGFVCLERAIPRGPLLLVPIPPLTFSVQLTLRTSPTTFPTPATLNDVTASVRFSGSSLRSFGGVQLDLVFDSSARLSETRRLFLASTLNDGAVVLPEAIPFAFPFLVQQCRLERPLICGPNVQQPTDPPSVSIPDLPNALKADVTPVMAFLSQQVCPR